MIIVCVMGEREGPYKAFRKKKGGARFPDCCSSQCSFFGTKWAPTIQQDIILACLQDSMFCYVMSIPCLEEYQGPRGIEVDALCSAQTRIRHPLQHVANTFLNNTASASSPTRSQIY